MEQSKMLAEKKTEEKTQTSPNSKRKFLEREIYDLLNNHAVLINFF